MAEGALLLPSAVGRRDVFTSKVRDELGRQPLGVSQQQVHTRGQQIRGRWMPRLCVKHS